MDDKKIKALFDKHFKTIGESFEKKIINKKLYVFDSFSHPPLSYNTLLLGSIFNTCNIRYGDFLEEIINLFLSENGALISEDKKTGNYDLLFEYKNTLYVGEIKIRDNHDSSKKVGQLNNLINKAIKQKIINQDKTVIAIFYFIDSNENKNGGYYLKELKNCIKLQNQFDDAKVFYGDDFFKELNLLDKWNELKNKIMEINNMLTNMNYIQRTIADYLKEKQLNLKDNKITKTYEEILKIIEKTEKDN